MIETELLPRPLLTWLAAQDESTFPPNGGVPYLRKFELIAEYLNKKVHPHVEKGPLAVDGGFLTDHGPDHIATVIQRASALLDDHSEKFPRLTSYEVFLLLMAIHFHDVGNLYGREEHEKKASEVMDIVAEMAKLNVIERRTILRIARAHGGKLNGDSDTISVLPPKETINSQSIRTQSLAAILRFADELADDSSRAHAAMEKLGVISKGSEVFHAYASALHSVQVKPHEHVVNLGFAFHRNDAERTFGKQGKGKLKHVYLLDEIYDRTFKMHLERQYCMRFWPSTSRIDAIVVKIEVYESSKNLELCIPAIGYTLRESGYPAPKLRSVKPFLEASFTSGSKLKQTLKALQQ